MFIRRHVVTRPRFSRVQGHRVLFSAFLILFAQQLPAAALGLLADNAGDRISIFNADSDQVSLNMAATPGQAVGDCAISSDQHLGITTNSSSVISFIDMDVPETASADYAGRLHSDSVVISNLGIDMSLSPDDTFLVTAGGGALQQPLSVVNISERQEVAVSSPFVDHTSVEFCDDGTLLVTTSNGPRYGSGDNALYDAVLDEVGEIHLIGGRVSSGAQPNNSACAPGSRSGVMLDRDGALTSFVLPTMQVADHQATRGDMAVSAAFSSDGRRLYVRTADTVEAFDFDPASGMMAAAWVQEVPRSSTFYGMDQIAVHPDGDKLYVDGGDALLILDPANGELFGTILAGDATGVCFANNPVAIEGSGTGGHITVAAAAP